MSLNSSYPTTITTTSNTTTVVKTRFAPSPTGLMHFGNLRVALFNYLFTKHEKGRFLLRVEDTDKTRSEAIYRDAILKDLEWLNLPFEEGPYYQSQRQAIYDEHYTILKNAEKIYPCFCSEEQLELTRKIQLASGQPPRYPGTCTHLTAAEVQAKKDAGLPFTLRFKLEKGQLIEFTDLVKGPQKFDSDHMGDFIVQRQDGTAPFMFCNAVDDAKMGITHTLRGDDHLTNTPRQILILKTLGLPVPQYGHFPTILGPDSRPLSKRNGSRSIQELREEGYLPLAILNYLARLGHTISDNTFFTIEELAAHFELNNISKGAAHYDVHQLDFWQKEAMHNLSTKDCWAFIAPYAKNSVPENKTEAFVEAIQKNIIKPIEAEFWAEAIFSDAEDVSYSDDIRKVLSEAGPDFFLNASEILKTVGLEYKRWVESLQEKTNKKGKALFFPLRAALTTVLYGPELEKVLKLIGIDKARHRLLRAAHHATYL